MKNAIMILIVSMFFASCTSARISSDLASGAIGCCPDEIKILNETASFVGARHNFEAICRGKRFICSYQPTTGINCKEALQVSMEDMIEDTTEKNMMDQNAIYDALENGVVKDTETGLEWKLGPDRDVSWDEAKLMISKFKLDGPGWRMPKEDELKRLYLKGVKPRNMGLLLKADGWPVWSVENKGPEARYFHFIKSGESYWYDRYAPYDMRAVAVRSSCPGEQGKGHDCQGL